MKGIHVQDPKSIVIIKSNCDSKVMIACQDSEDVLLHRRGEKARISWSDYITAKSRPGFGNSIELDDSVTITQEGFVRIADADNHLTEDTMSELIAMPTDRIKEFALSMNDGEKEVFRSFLETRLDLGIEVEKCTILSDFLGEKKKKPGRPAGKRASNVDTTEKQEAKKVDTIGGVDLEEDPDALIVRAKKTKN